MSIVTGGGGKRNNFSRQIRHHLSVVFDITDQKKRKKKQEKRKKRNRKLPLRWQTAFKFGFHQCASTLLVKEKKGTFVTSRKYVLQRLGYVRLDSRSSIRGRLRKWRSVWNGYRGRKVIVSVGQNEKPSFLETDSLVDTLF